MGYARAGFEVVGVDHEEQPRYPFEFRKADWQEVFAEPKFINSFDAIHASPPCQAFSQTKTIHAGKPHAKHHPNLIHAVREQLGVWAMGRPRRWVIENVPGAPLMYPITLCGTYFGLRVKRHRLFESNAMLLAPAQECTHPPRGSFVQAGRPIHENSWVIVAGHISGVAKASKAMGVDWPMSRDELVQAIPPAYTEFVGRQLIDQL